MQRRSSRGQKGVGRKAKGMRADAGGKRRGTCLEAHGHQSSQSLLFQQQKTASLNASAEAGAQCVRA
jgi:hypothetical protein